MWSGSPGPEAGAGEALLNPTARPRGALQQGLKMGPVIPDPAPGPDPSRGLVPVGAHGGTTLVHTRALVHVLTLADATLAVGHTATSTGAAGATATPRCPTADDTSAIGRIRTLTAAWVCSA